MVASAGFAQNADWYVVGEGPDRTVFGGDLPPEGTPLLQGESGQKPADCPAGSFYEGSGGSIVSCDDTAAIFDLQAPESGSTMATGEAWPENAMILRPRESGEQKGSDTNSNTGAGSTTQGGGG
jgi:hypothetical protein